MNWSQGGEFTKSLLSLQLQLQTILEGVGGEEAAGLMDALAKLSNTERATVIPMLTRIIARLVTEHDRVLGKEEQELKEFENALFESVLSAVQGNGGSDVVALNEDEGRSKLAVLPGGKGPIVAKTKPVRLSALIDLQKAREARRFGRSE
jgi:hypothetical protein